ncbi:putative mrna cap methyltransferase protein [Phaeoacremonium minimum UCRPA7]|uniref:mRNA cap guanine-N(7) methyltransferase n=1 Tax=Phaeoacremonium minimum (strain UCR-PA7) TaxID=1286976 RepID=R8BR09_PHAM7|nr:putative mrna cap methyltransferase protein [Phaeoacremonium minimum UCRPA7]EOO01808.1 putative mrna cap methyltransferase protein [Phaeoacremonium minimum UCRPA7]
MAGDNDFEDQPQAFDAKRLEPARKRHRSESPSRNGSPSSSSHRAKKSNRDDVPDELPQPYDAKTLAAAKRRTSPSGGDREPPRKLKRPGQRARISEAEREHIRQRALERERELAREAEEARRGAINDVVRAHYNAVPERGRDWRKTDSRIKGLRSFNNWVKSCIIQKFSPDEDHAPGAREYGISSGAELLVLDIGCGKGGDLGKWQQAPQTVQLYVGLDPAEISIEQAKERYRSMSHRGGGGRGGRGGFNRRPPPRLFESRFHVKDCYGESIEDIDVVRQVGFAQSNISSSRGFDVVSMMFCMHYAFETEAKARQMLKNVAGALKKGGRFIGTIPNSDVISEQVRAFNAKMEAKAKAPPVEVEVEEGEEREEGEAEETAEWGNGIYRVRFPGKTPEDGIFRPPFGWKYNFFLHEAVEEVPEYVVPWEAFRALAEDYNLELQYHKTFTDIWETEKDDETLGPLSERMGVRSRHDGSLLVTPEEMEAASFYVGFCFYKV